MIPEETLSQILDRFAFLEAQMAAGAEADAYVRLSKEYAQLEPVALEIKRYRKLVADLGEARAMADDPELGEVAAEEVATIEAALPDAEHALKIALLPKDEADTKSAILEVRAGTGGDEAALFAGDLFSMYSRYAAEKGWRVEVMEESPGEMGGFREIIASISGEGVFARLKYESGVHRVQRVPATETQGRIHTSAATVAVLPEAEEIDIEIRTEDIRVDTMRASGAGGQHVNTTDSAVRITHLPTGIVVTSSEKSQHQNRARALQVLRARLFDQKREEAEAARSADRKGQVGSGDRSERIRTYNFPQGRVTDHRINLTLYKLDPVLAGGLDEFVDPLTSADQAEKLAAMENP
ncbi:MAG: peptide chain release factor 1 [Neomegalonema sp.]|nr:peptide chain release factor 1 [Neomegalonema sp.]